MIKVWSAQLGRNYHRGLNSQGTLLLSAKTTENIKVGKSSILQRTISIYNRVTNEEHLRDLAIAKKLCSSAIKDGHSKLIDIIYIAATYLDKAKKSKVLQIYMKIPNGQEHSVIVLEKCVFESQEGNMWRVLGVI